MDSRCTECGNMLDVDAMFCHLCGAQVSNAAVVAETGPAEQTNHIIQGDPAVSAANASSSLEGKPVRNKTPMLIVTAIALVMMAIAVVYGLQGESGSTDTSDVKQQITDTNSDGETNSDQSAAKMSSKAPLNSNDIALLKQNVITRHAEYNNSLMSKSVTVDQKRSAYKQAVFELQTGLRSYYVDGKRGTAQQATSELTAFMAGLSGESFEAPVLKTADATPLPPKQLTLPSNTPAPVKKAGPKSTARRTAQTKQPVTTTTTAPKPITKSEPVQTPASANVDTFEDDSDDTDNDNGLMSASRIEAQKEKTEEAYLAYRSSASRNSIYTLQKRAVYDSNVIKLSSYYNLYYVVDQRGTVSDSQKALNNFLREIKNEADSNDNDEDSFFDE